MSCRRRILAQSWSHPSLLGCLLAAAVGCQRPAVATPPTEPGAPAAEPDLPPPLAAAVAELHAAVHAERIRVGTPAAALVIVKDDRVIHAAGYGLRGDAQSLPVDTNTVFAIGSATKAFTAMLVMQAVDAGKLDLDDSPKRCLPDFTLKDPDADQHVTVRDLLTHRSGLGSTDMAWYAGNLTRAELLAVAAQAEPVAPYGQQIHYQNLMVVAAGECAARALGGSYEALVRARIFAPLGMHDASIDIASLRATDNRAQGHARIGEDRRAVVVPPKDIDAIAPAGGINASVEAMVPWLRVMLNGGRLGDVALVSPASFQRIVAPHVTMAPGVQYGLGWVVDQWRGQKRLWHNGGIDGYYALVSMLPEAGIGFVLLTADDSAALEPLVTDRVFELAFPAAVSPSRSSDAQTVAARAFVGTYGIVGGFQAVLTAQDAAGLTLAVAGQPPYPLLPGDDGAWVLGPPAPAGLGARLAGQGDARTLTIVQPQGPIVLPWLDPDTLAAARTAPLPKAEAAMLGVYHDPKTGIAVRLVASEGRVALAAAGQAPAPLVARDKDTYGLDGLPNAFAVKLVRTRGRVVGIELAQPQGALSLGRVPDTEPVTEDVASLLGRVARAHGSAALAKHSTMVIESNLAFVHQGVQGVAQTHRAAPDRFAETLTLLALDKQLATIWVGHDGKRAWERSTFSSVDDLTAVKAEALALGAAFDPWADPLAGWADSEIVGVDLVPGFSEPAIFVRRSTRSGITWTDAFGRRSLRLLQRTTSVPNGDGTATVEVQRFDDYRDVAGVAVPHAVESTTENGTVVSLVQSVRLDVEIPAAAWQPPAP